MNVHTEIIVILNLIKNYNKWKRGKKWFYQFKHHEAMIDILLHKLELFIDQLHFIFLN